MSGFKKGKTPLKRQTLKRKHSHVLRKLAIAFAIVLVAIELYIKVQPYTLEAKRERQLESTTHQLQQTKEKLEQTQVQSEQQFNEQKKQLDEVNKKLQDAEQQLQARRATQKAYAASIGNVGNCSDWIAQAGLPNSYAVNKLVHNESGCNPNAVNSSSGACGIAQELPCGKSGCGLGNPVCQLKWMNTYVQGRYGTWENALATWESRSPHWY